MIDPVSRDVLLYGAGGHARVCLDLLLEDPGVAVVGIVSDDGRGRSDLGDVVRMAAPELQRLTESGTSATFCVAIGENLTRQLISRNITDSGHSLTQAVSRSALVAESVKLGSGVQILPGAVVMAAAVLGDGVIVNTNASVDHDCVVGAYAHIAPGVALGGDVRIGTRTLVGLGARVLPGVTVGADVVIGGGAVVIRDVADGLTVVGNPAARRAVDGAGYEMRPADALRRAVDLIVGVVGLVVLAPVLGGLAVAVRVSIGSPVIYRQRRLGIGGRPFELLKFRSMRHPAPGREDPLFDAERMTRLGHWMRAASLDELPSMWNLVRGDVTLVGPRPLPVHYWPRYRREEYERFTVRPGITGLAQVEGRNLLTWDERLALDVAYVRNRTVLGDLRILVGTVPAVLGGTGVDAAEGVTMTELPADRP